MNKTQGIIVILITSIVFVFIFFNEPLKNPNNTFFAGSGDGLKDYYTTTYLINYDTCYWHSNAMNYPHGEHVFFTGNQVSISFIVKFISENIFDISNYTVAIMNIFMLLSIVLGALFLFLILHHFKLPVIFSIIAAIGICLLSPQIARMSGHFALSYIFVIPAILYCIVKFHEKPAYWKSIIMGFLLIWAFGSHIYMLGFYCMIVILYWVFIYLLQQNKLNYKEGFFHLSIQLILPIILFFIINIITDNITDRSSHPWGFLHYTAYPQSVLLPIGRPYAQFLHKISNFSNIDWEGYAFVGLVASVGFFVVIFNFIKKLILRKKMFLNHSDENILLLNVFLLISIIGLLYSFGLPFKFGLQRLVDYIGPLRQMRGIARFSWIFFYVINIYVFYHIWNLKKTTINKYVWRSLVIISLGFLWYDGLYNINFWSKFVNNKIPVLTEQSEINPEWQKIIEKGNYQAILPIPYFHIGSENIWIEPKNNINTKNFIVSWKTGLPSMGVYMSRTSLSQTIMNNQLCWEAYRKPEILSLLNPDMDILVITTADDSYIPEPQENIVRKSSLVYNSDEFNLYRLEYDSLVSLTDNLYEQNFQDYQQKKLFDFDIYQSDSEHKYFITDTLNQKENNIFYITKGGLTQKFNKKGWWYTTEIPDFGQPAEVVLSFWVNDIYKDLFLRSHLIVELRDSLNNVYDYHHQSLFRLIKTVDENWALIELNLNIQQPKDLLKFRLRNRNLRNDYYTIDEIMIRRSDISVYKNTDSYLMKNNRFYFK